MKSRPRRGRQAVKSVCERGACAATIRRPERMPAGRRVRCVRSRCRPASATSPTPVAARTRTPEVRARWPSHAGPAGAHPISAERRPAAPVREIVRVPKSARPRRHSTGAATKAAAAMKAASALGREVTAMEFASAMKPFSSSAVESSPAATPRRRRVRQANQCKSRHSAKDDFQSSGFRHGRSLPPANARAKAPHLHVEPQLLGEQRKSH